jgi:hypothetical protein
MESSCASARAECALPDGITMPFEHNCGYLNVTKRMIRQTLQPRMLQHRPSAADELHEDHLPGLIHSLGELYRNDQSNMCKHNSYNNDERQKGNQQNNNIKIK